MKKSLIAILFVSTALVANAQTYVCVDLNINLVRGSESKYVLALQNFLYEKGVLKATPNGYFGPATLAAVKAFQKSVGLSQVGNTGPLTRAAIKKESCGGATVSTAPTPPALQSLATTTQQSATVPQTLQYFPRPVTMSFDLVTLFAEGKTDWGFNMYGSNFSTSTNTVNFRNVYTRRTYTIGTFPSASGTVIVLPANITGTAYPCGSGCLEKLSAGRYEVTVTNAGGESEPKTLDIKAFTITAQTSAVQGAIPASATNAKLGLLTFSPSVPVIVKSVNLAIFSSAISASGISGTTLKDEMTGLAPEGNAALSGFQSMIIGAYATTNNTIPGTFMANFTLEVEDYIGKKRTTFTSPSFLVTVAGVL
jgi:peptidoglycan hydrolase-like protein with peptidoglycan-binding domain